ncbi:MAG: ATP-binding cassette domain-containing protein [Ilumatobacteraceae bacterium]|nr:ATP-binding cassette domain-containing protein [Ilumatobacteraceae bacterium]
MSTPLLAASGITKRYGAVVALREVGMQLRAGRVRAIVGENGAGKSTLTGVLAGLVHPDAGEVHLDGEPVRFAGRRDAIAHGIGLVPQHLSLVGARRGTPPRPPDRLRDRRRGGARRRDRADRARRAPAR